VNNSIKIFALLTILVTGCNSSPPKSQLTINTVTDSAPVVQRTQAMPISSTFNSSEIPNPSGQWVFIVADTYGSQISIDANTAQRQGDLVSFWQQRILPTPDQFGSSIYLNYQSIDCKAAVFRFHKDIYLDASGNIINQAVGDSPLQNIAPGSVGAQVFMRTCGQSQSAQTDIVKARLEALSRDRQTNADSINNALTATQGMFRP
jgi:hypothetical protein